MHEAEARLDPPSMRAIARFILVPFVLTFIASRVLVYLIMARAIPDLYMHLGGTHIHHLNYGIFLLSAVGAYLLFVPPAVKARKVVAVIYGVGLALTFDEFGMWLHLGGSYWQRASYDAIVVVASVLGSIAFAPPLHRWRGRHIETALVMVAAVGIFGALLLASLRYADEKLPALQQIEQDAPP
jgi:hypothetical protein